MKRKIKGIAAAAGLIIILLLLSDSPASATPETLGAGESSAGLNIEKQLIEYNVGGEIVPKYLVIHETDNYRATADAKSHADWNDSDPDARSSAHFYVDDGQIIQVIEMNRRANTIGGNSETQEIHNNNSIAIEMCVNEGSNYLMTVENTIKLIREHILPEAKKQGWTLTLARHKDAWGKNCPQRLISGEWGVTWEEFIDRVYTGLEYTRLAVTSSDSTPKAVSIMGYISFDKDQAKKITLGYNGNPSFTQDLDNYLSAVEKACKLENINPYVAFCQSALETGWFRFEGDVSYGQNNFAGLGATGNGVPGEAFPDIYTGVLAQVQHLKAYASKEPLKADCVDTRFEMVERGSAPMVSDLSGKWAADKDYGAKIMGIYGRVNIAEASAGKPDNENTIDLLPGSGNAYFVDLETGDLSVSFDLS